MNYQKGRNDKRLLKVNKVLKNHEYDPMYYAWPQVFSSTAGPFGGVGGQAMTTFTVEAFVINDKAALFIGDKFWRKVDDFDLTKALNGQYR